MIKKAALCLLFGTVLVICVVFAGDEKPEISKTKVKVSGTFTPAGPPLEPPKRVAAGNGRGEVPGRNGDKRKGKNHGEFH